MLSLAIKHFDIEATGEIGPGRNTDWQVIVGIKILENHHARYYDFG